MRTCRCRRVLMVGSVITFCGAILGPFNTRGGRGGSGVRAGGAAAAALLGEVAPRSLLSSSLSPPKEAEEAEASAAGGEDTRAQAR